MQYKIFGLLLGLAVGLAVPAGAVLAKMHLAGWRIDAGWIFREVRFHRFFYVYMTMVGPALTALCGFILGWLTDKLSYQAKCLAAVNQKLGYESITDDLTGIYNHRYLLWELEKEIQRAKRYRRVFSLMMLDVDDFKAINDRHGHLAGDKVLRILSSILRHNIRRVDTAGRYGGDEFMIVLPEITLHAAEFMAQRIQAEFAKGMKRAGMEPLGATISIGISTSEGTAEPDKMTLIQKADSALLEAKGLGKNKIIFADKGPGQP